MKNIMAIKVNLKLKYKETEIKNVEINISRSNNIYESNNTRT